MHDRTASHVEWGMLGFEGAEKTWHALTHHHEKGL